MKTSKKYLAILLTLCTLLCSIISYSVYALNVEEETPISADADLGNEGELMPMAADNCETHTCSPGTPTTQTMTCSCGKQYTVTIQRCSICNKLMRVIGKCCN